jgi:hypothetical protein
VVRSIVSQDDTLDGKKGPTSALLKEVVHTLLQALDEQYTLGVGGNGGSGGSEGSGGNVHQMGSAVVEWIEVCREITFSLCHSSTPEKCWSPNVESTLVWVEKNEQKEQTERKKKYVEQRKNKLLQVNPDTKEKNSSTGTGTVHLEGEFVSFVKSLVQDQSILNRMMDPTTDIDQHEVDEEKADEEKADEEKTDVAATPVETSVEAILRRCVHYLSSSSIRVRVSTLCTLNMGMRVLHGNDRLLLPLVATIWPAVRTSARSTNVPVSCSALACVCTMALLCGDFVRARFNKELWPLLRKRMLQEIARNRSSVRESDLMAIANTAQVDEDPQQHRRPRRPRRHGSQQSKHLQCILSTLSVLSSQGMLKADNVLEISTCCCRLLSIDRKVSDGIRQCALKVLQRLHAIYPEMVWYAATRAFGCRLEKKGRDGGVDVGGTRLPTVVVVVVGESKTMRLWEGGVSFWKELLRT